MWPVKHEMMTRDECRKCLRCLELDAYGSMVSVLRAQGPFTNEKQKLLQELAKVLHISNERHRAEVRRAVNDEKLATIAEQLNGPNTGTDWTIEGRRAIPLLPRLKARSAFTTLANSLSLATVAANRRNLSIHERSEDTKDNRSESPVKNVQEKILSNNELSPNEDKIVNENVLNQVIESDRNNDASIQSNNSDVDEKCTVSEKRKPSSPLPISLPNKVLVVSSNSIGTLNHGIADKGSLENTIHLSRVTTNSLQPQSLTIIPLNVNCGENDTDSKEPEVQENASNHSVISSGNLVNAVMPVVTTTSITKTKGKIIATQNKLNAKIVPTISVSSNVSPISTSNLQQPDAHDTPIQSAKTSSVSHTVEKALNSENSNTITNCTKRVVPVIHSNVKPPITNTITSSNSHRLMAVCPPGTSVSNGPGPPQAKQTTTLTCKKLPTTLNNQTTAKMGVTLNSNKTVNISHPNTKLGSKTNVIVIQKGQTKGVTLSQAGKEVLGKVIMGGKNLCVTSQHNASINVLPITLNNGDQAVTMLSTTNSSHTESVASNIKSGNTIMFNLRQDVLEKNKTLSHLLESSNVLASESKTVIQNANTRLSKEPSNNDTHVQDKEILVKTDAVITSVNDEKHRSV